MRLYTKINYIIALDGGPEDEMQGMKQDSGYCITSQQDKVRKETESHRKILR